MKYEFVIRSDNVYVIDTKMFGFEHYMSCYLIKGKELALIDTGLRNQLETVLAGIKAHGFSVSDISHIFCTHEHHDHCGNVGPLLKMNPRIKVHIHPNGKRILTDPAGIDAEMKGKLLPSHIARFGTMEPVSLENIQFLNDGDVFDLGDGEKLRVAFAPGHQPGCVILFEEKFGGLFISDLVGNYFADCDAFIMLSPYRSDVIRSLESLNKLMNIPIKKLFLGHFGVSDKPQYVIQGAARVIQGLLDIGEKCIEEGKPDLIEPRVKAFRMLEAEKIRLTGAEELYNYTVEELIGHQSTSFAKYYLGLHNKQ
jgi:glyoxylase-like metal-dependent hydrolase (beta-lactamase superfamily II)